MPDTHFARNGDVHLAYQIVGSGPVDLLYVDAWVHHVEAVWDVPDFARLLRRLSSFSRLIHFDRRGTGLSDPVPLDRLPDVETQVDDAVAVLDAAGSSQAAVVGANEGTLVAILLAARHPERCRSLVLFATTAKHQHAAGTPMEDMEAFMELIRTNQVSGFSGVDVFAPSRAGEERFDRDLARLQRLSVRPGAIGHYVRQSIMSDVAGELPAIRTPTLVLNRTGNRIVSTELSREVASMIPNARHVELPGTDHLIFSEGIDAVADEIEEFVTGPGRAPTPTAPYPRSSSPTSWTRRPSRPSSGTAGGGTSSIVTTRSSVGRWSGSAAARWPPRVTGSSRPSMDRGTPYGSRWRRRRPWPLCGSASGPGSTRVRSRSVGTTSAGWPCTSGRVSPPLQTQAKCSSRPR